MVELDVRTKIPMETVIGKDADELEIMVQKKIMDELSEAMSKHVDDLLFIDMEMGADAIHIKAELVLCSKSDIITNAEIQAQKLASFGLSEEQILDVLETQLTDNKGF